MSNDKNYHFSLTFKDVAAISVILLFGVFLTLGTLLMPTPGLAQSSTQVVQQGAGGRYGTWLTTYQKKSTYSASKVGLASVATATDICTLTGSATKTIKVQRVTLTGTQTTGGEVTIVLAKRSSANTGGTSAAMTAVPADSTNAAATGTALSYTANPTGGGALVGNLDAQLIFVPATTAAGDLYVWTPGQDPNQNTTLRGIAEVIALNLNGVTVTGGSFTCTFQWTEE